MKKPYSSSNNYLGSLSIIVAMLSLFVLSSCGSSKLGAVPKDYQQLEALLDSGQFEIQNDWAIPQRGGNINLSGNSNYIRFQGDSVELFLPYFGVRHFGGGYGNNGGIEYEGLVEDIQINREEKRITMEFSAANSSEDYKFYLTLYPNGNSNTTVNSSQRDNISYRGTIREWTPVMEEGE